MVTWLFQALWVQPTAAAASFPAGVAGALRGLQSTRLIRNQTPELSHSQSKMQGTGEVASVVCAPRSQAGVQEQGHLGPCCPERTQAGHFPPCTDPGSKSAASEYRRGGLLCGEREAHWPWPWGGVLSCWLGPRRPLSPPATPSLAQSSWPACDASATVTKGQALPTARLPLGQLPRLGSGMRFSFPSFPEC